MFRRKSIGLLAVLAALGVFAVSAASASAAATSVLPSKGSSKLLKEWTGVNCTVKSSGSACAGTKFLSVSNASILKFGTTTISNCIVELEGTIGSHGETTISRVAVKAGDAICSGIKAVTPWADQICEYKESTPHQFWDRIEVKFEVPELGTIKGPMFVHLTGTSGAQTDPLEVMEAYAPGSEIGSTGFSITANGSPNGLPFVFTTSPSFPPVVVASNTEKCPWPNQSTGVIE
jgi:hypothetical protein